MSAERSALPSHEVAGWGYHPVVRRPVARPGRVSDVVDLVRRHDVIGPRGLGRSYGDASLAAEDGLVLDLRWLDRWRHFDADAGVLRCEAGVSLRQVIEGILPHGWFLPVSPGTQSVTLGGAVASDIHGKNHHGHGSFGEHVRGLTLVTADGELRRCSPTEQPALFWATVGGMGLTGAIVEVELDLLRVESAWIRQRTLRCPDFDSLVEAFQRESDWAYSVAWLDISGGSRPGRGLLLLGEHARADELRRHDADRWALDTRRRVGVPLRPPLNLLSSFNVKLFNRTYYAGHSSSEKLLHYSSFFYPLDAVRGWNRLYGPRGFLQYQFVVPEDQGYDVLTRVFGEIQTYGRSSFLSVLKKMGPPSDAPLSFSLPGWTLALDFPRTTQLPSLLERLDRHVLDAGGRVYLTKDARLSPGDFREMYPRYADWLTEKRRVDSGAKFRSVQSARLGIDADVVGDRT